MAIAFGTAGAGANGTSSVILPYPTSISAGDLLVATIVNKYPANAPATPTDWTLLAAARKQGGNGTNGPDRGQVFMSVFYKIATGSESGSLTFTITSGNSSRGRMFRYTRGGTGWDIAATGGAENTVSLTWDVTMDADPGITSGDVLLACTAVNGDAVLYSSPSLTAAGATIGSGTEREEAGTGGGQDCKLYVVQFSCTAGTATAAAQYTHTNGSSAANTPAGATVLFRMREVTASSAPGLPFTYCT